MRHSVRARVLQTLTCAGVLILPASAMAAGGSPLHVDPSSPVAKEYALPLATARGAPPESGRSGRLFGSGIKHSSSTSTPVRSVVAPPPTIPQSEPAVTSTSETTAHARRPHRRHHRHRRRPAEIVTVTLPAPTHPQHTGEVTGTATPAAYRVLRPGSGSGLLWMALAAVVVVALGSAGGLALRRRR